MSPASFLMTVLPGVLLLTSTMTVQVTGAQGVSACVGETVTLPCHTTKHMGVDWRYRTTLNSDGSYVVVSGYVQDNFRQRFALNRSGHDQQSLVISRLRISDQGLYICIEDAGLGPRHEHRLVVHDKCNSRLSASSVSPVASTGGGRQTVFIGVGIIIFVVVALAATVVLLIRRRRRRRRRQREMAEEAEASSGDVTEELDDLRRSFAARLRSESLQRQNDNLDKDSRIQQLEVILKSQLVRERAKNQRIAELEDRVDAIAQSSEPGPQQTAELKTERTTLLSEEDEDIDVESETDTGRTHEDRIHSNTSQVVAPQSRETAGEKRPQKAEIRHLDKIETDDKASPSVHGQKLSDRRTGFRRKFPVLSKLIPSQTK